MHILLRYLLCTLFITTISSPLYTQKEWQVGVYGQYELDVPGTRSFQFKGVSPAAFAGIKMTNSKVHAGVYFHVRWERMREDSVNFQWFYPGTRENLRLDNLMMGPSLQFIVFPEKKIQLLLGVEIFIGSPLRARYEFFGPAPNSTTMTFPSYAQIKGGIGLLGGWQGHVGMAGRLSARQDWQLRLGFGHSDQNYNWGISQEIGGFGRIVSGRFYSVSLGTVHTL